MPHSAHPARRTPALLIVGAVTGAAALLAATLAVPAATAAPTHRGAPSVGATAGASVAGTALGRREKAHRALATAQRALAPTTTPGPRPDATMALRRLVLLKDSLPAAERAAAEKLLGRPPGKTSTSASGNIRIHWNAAEMAGSPFTPADVLNTAVHVSQTYSGAGYRKPLKDGSRGGDNKTDVYVDSLQAGAYGYCTTDDNSVGQGGKFDTWAFCVVDNDYAGFPLNTPLENLQVTVAHEYFHATQYAYDAAEDGWFIEGTAAWAEDEVYDAVDDNVQYLKYSPITTPKRPMDKFGGLYHYGTWIFFRYLTEKIKQSKGGMPKLMLDFWKAADSSNGPKKNKYSLEAIAKVLQGRKFAFDRAFSLFSDINRRAQKAYDEGNINNYPQKKLAGKKTLKNNGQTKQFKAKLNHLSSATYQFDSESLGGKSKLKLVFDLAAKDSGARAVVTTYKNSGKAKSRFVKLNGQGDKKLSVAFNSSDVDHVEVTIVNASIQMKNCYPPGGGTQYACQGKPDDQNVRGSVRGTVVK